MRRLTILNISPSNTAGTPSSITVGLDQTSLFHGKEWISASGTRSPFWTYSSTGPVFPPTGTTLLQATSFEIVENPTFNGTYTVYTKLSSTDVDSSSFNGTNTVIRINQTIPAVGTDLNVGYVTNISTYSLLVAGESSITVLENQTLTSRPLDLVGRNSIGWGEAIQQNMVRLAQCFAGPLPPSTITTGQRPFQGQLWFDTQNSALMVKPTASDTNDWVSVSKAGSNSPGSSFRFNQSTASSTWNITHNLNVPAPYIVEGAFFIDVGAGVYKPILPTDVQYTSADTVTVSFSSPEVGYAIIRSTT